jgi:hypothetical protein
MIAVTTIYATSDAAMRQSSLARTLAPHYLLAPATAASGSVGDQMPPAVFILLLASLCGLQILLTLRTGGRALAHDAVPRLL